MTLPLAPLTLEPLYRGETLALRLAVKNDDGTAKDLTGGDAFLVMTRTNTLVPNVTEVDEVAAIEAPQTGGIVVATLEPEQTALLAPVTYSWEIPVIDSAGRKQIVARGYVTVRDPIVSALS